MHQPTASGPTRFGFFIAPYHPLNGNPTLQLQRDLELVELADRLGFAEAWVGEHHSAGMEIIAAPEVFLAAAAQRTTHIRLGTGVNSLPYHQPMMLADRLCLVDHLTKGRLMMGIGPGQLASDAAMMGIPQPRQRDMMYESMDVLVRLFRGEVVTAKTDWFELDEARLQLLPYQQHGLEMAVASTISPSGAVLAGRHGAGLLSLAASDPSGYEALLPNFRVYEQTMAEYGHTVRRADWRLVAPMHLAETRDQARREVEWGIGHLVDYIRKLSGMDVPWGDTAAEAVAQWVGPGFPAFGRATIGTPDDAIAAITDLAEQSGGFGTFLVLALDVADRDATRRSARLFAEHVIPHFTRANRNRVASLDWANANSERLMSGMRAGVEAAFERHGQALAAALRPRREGR
ncbi:LLM class flavin-dependent oxidoreductase [Nocardia otitidiscaviarum]|uniref:LLM class flavin-dependent oxidoreductase n=1 Tax=Nocardia otitidiscaviarum TaxID=1823 RepID=UPI0018940ED9|nr:LLM class flavin-dependent oxidoreductase [Nocardia otitidiscaviarum]MBF6182859.1 LLM class flavin-dependent oxidoreductase [Nocardia otitidiscaviarum]